MQELARLCAFVAVKSDPGREPEKQVNEDAFGYQAIAGTVLAVVCDGMGGHTGGRLASSTAVQALLSGVASSRPEATPRERLRSAVELAAAAVYRIGGETPAQERPGATCVAVWLHADSLEVAHVGDSRCYRLRRGRLEALTRDHSVIEAWIQAGQLTREQAHLHPDAHRITKALGIEPAVEAELRQTDGLVVGDKLLLCSDGLTDLVPDTDIANVLGRPAPLEHLVEELVALANARGGHDNITALLLQVADGAALQPATVGSDGSPLCFALTKSAVAASATEQFQQPRAAAETQPLVASIARTVVMDERPEVLPNQATLLDSPTAGPVGKTQPLQHLGDLGKGPGQPLGNLASAPPNGTVPRRLWSYVGLALLLIIVAIALGLMQRR